MLDRLDMTWLPLHPGERLYTGAARVCPPFSFPSSPAVRNRTPMSYTGSAPMLSTRTAYAPGPPNDDAVLGWGHGGRVQVAMHCRETKTSIRIFTESGLLLL